LTHELRAVLTEALRGHALARALEAGLHEEREGEVALPPARGAPRKQEGRGGAPAVGEAPLGPPLVERETEGQRVGRVTGDAEELADRGDVALAVRTVEALGDVEDEVGSDQREPRGKALVRLE